MSPRTVIHPAISVSLSIGIGLLSAYGWSRSMTPEGPPTQQKAAASSKTSAPAAAVQPSGMTVDEVIKMVQV